MRLLNLLPLAGLAAALPQADSNCVTITTELIVPTSTYTFDSTVVVTLTATTPDDLGTFTDVVRVSSTSTLGTITSTSTDCTASGTITAGPTTTVYTSAGQPASTSSSPSPSGYGPPGYGRMFMRQDGGCTVTSYSFTTTYGVTETYLPASRTSTYTRYTEFTQHTVTSTSYGGTAYAMATAVATTAATCGPTVNGTAPTTTVTRDARCADSAIISQASGFGLDWLNDTPGNPGATYVTTTGDAGECCQICADADSCAGSAWDIRSGSCRVEFAVGYDTNELQCGDEAGLAFYNYGPNHPMSPGTGWYVADLCGHWDFANTKPDDGS
ncbi:hypothetical protein K431DRAFT_56098 [Polychaeton citri CBS 116435]|uniref:Apple domain-containing protein n=1 Tax=Polychaeton citri CBS 116435 TaxID=1314669 RepID=A0A9P4QHP3_9PEZI|nr:hypothetical protein K431DRAFT_56098 [Polychaeton citri CBS 116435]